MRPFAAALCIRRVPQVAKGLEASACMVDAAMGWGRHAASRLSGESRCRGTEPYDDSAVAKSPENNDDDDDAPATTPDMQASAPDMAPATPPLRSRPSDLMPWDEAEDEEDVFQFKGEQDVFPTASAASTEEEPPEAPQTHAEPTDDSEEEECVCPFGSAPQKTGSPTPPVCDSCGHWTDDRALIAAMIAQQEKVDTLRRQNAELELSCQDVEWSERARHVCRW